MYQKTIVIGHLGRDPEMRYTPSGLAVTSFSVASSRKWTDKNGQQQEKTTWFRVTAWDKLGELCNQYLTKGKLVFVEGDIDASAYTSQDGQPRASLELTARNIRFLSGGGQGSEAEGVLRERGPVMEEDIPF
ncbi:MAG: single-stranded DNA-binding protein [Caldilineales bacterium]|nr:single-stranded DNA-binding protein [Caldilineales bacterium]MCW5857657.1 single-stranded DNA-binding protein [Caldilineales bacterium]